MNLSIRVAPVSVLMLLVAACSASNRCCTPERASPPAASNASADPRQGSTPPSTAPAADSAISQATFVPLDFDRFPTLSSAQAPSGRSVTVAKSGGDYTSIGAALRDIDPGTVVWVAGGEYFEQDSECEHCGLVLRKPVLLMARPGDKVVVRPHGDAHTGLTIEASDVVIRGMDLLGFRSLGVVWSGAVARTVLADMRIDGADEGIATMDTPLDGLLAFNLRISNASAIGFHCGVGPCRNWRLENVDIDLSTRGTGSGADAFAVESGDNFLLINVTATGASADGIDVKGTRVVVYGCHVHHVRRNGIKLWQGGDIINTLVHHTGADAALVTEQGRIRILHSVFAFHNHHADSSYFATLGYARHGVTQAEIINSVFFNAAGAIWVDAAAKLSVDGSIFWGNDNGQVLEHGDQVISLQGGERQFVARGFGKNRIADPRLNDQFVPDVSSPARNAGTRLSRHFPAYDRRGQPRVLGSAPDVGAFEIE